MKTPIVMQVGWYLCWPQIFAAMIAIVLKSFEAAAFSNFLLIFASLAFHIRHLPYLQPDVLAQTLHRKVNLRSSCGPWRGQARMVWERALEQTQIYLNMLFLTYVVAQRSVFIFPVLTEAKALAVPIVVFAHWQCVFGCARLSMLWATTSCSDLNTYRQFLRHVTEDDNKIYGNEKKEYLVGERVSDV